MRPLFLAFGVWCTGFLAAILGLYTAGGADSAVLGTIVAEYTPFCESFVVETERGFVILEWEDGILVFAEGDEVSGPLHTRGLQSIDLVGHGQMMVRVQDWTLDLRHAQKALQDRCNIGPDTNLTAALRG